MIIDKNNADFYAPLGQLTISENPVRNIAGHIVSNHGLRWLIKPKPDHEIDYASSTKKGLNSIQKAADSLFNGEKRSAPAKPDRDIAKKFIEDGGIDSQMHNYQPQNFANGGEVTKGLAHNEMLANMLPEHNILLNAARSRVSNYLKSNRPLAPMGLPFDTKKTHPLHEREYHHLIDLANDPLSITDTIKKGRLTAKALQHFKSMYPEVHDELAHHITRNITEHQLAEKRPPKHIRQSLSLFMGADLDSSTSPQIIMAAQNTFRPAQAPQQQGQPKGSKKGMKEIGQNALTDDQARESRSQKQ